VAAVVVLPGAVLAATGLQHPKVPAAAAALMEAVALVEAAVAAAAVAATIMTSRMTHTVILIMMMRVLAGSRTSNANGAPYNDRQDRGAYNDRKEGAYSERSDAAGAAEELEQAPTQASAATSAPDTGSSSSSSWFGMGGWHGRSSSGGEERDSSSANGSSTGPDDENASDDMFEQAAAELDIPFEEPPPPPAVPPEVLAAAGAVSLVRSSWLERQALRTAATNSSAGEPALLEPLVEYIHLKDQYGAHLVQVKAGGPDSNETELWHAFPRHAFAFTHEDMAHLERLTALNRRWCRRPTCCWTWMWSGSRPCCTATTTARRCAPWRPPTRPVATRG